MNVPSRSQILKLVRKEDCMNQIQGLKESLGFLKIGQLVENFIWYYLSLIKHYSLIYHIVRNIKGIPRNLWRDFLANNPSKNPCNFLVWLCQVYNVNLVSRDAINGWIPQPYPEEINPITIFIHEEIYVLKLENLGWCRMS